ncbi:MAG: PSD1 and planctomycete cytochrome C domain-containing protein [Planctomycetota bacterium]|nr:PSD1 and planctomycete cytochrome C domain-containing protein [Planctomycetota bacterium]MDA1178119.1 PSD1 and planctomycete cytochrome C domain-containing protein [Planctomycetota bacterium]
MVNFAPSLPAGDGDELQLRRTRRLTRELPHVRTLVLAGIRLLAVAAFGFAGTLESRSDTTLDYSRDVYPILADHCLQCHGPDQEQRQAGLRLDVLAVATQPLESGQIAIQPGNARDSELMKRVTMSDPDLCMPPPSTKKRLSAEHVQILRRWIDAGALMTQHWSYQRPVRPPMPMVRTADWSRNPIDRFVLAQLDALNTSATREATRSTLIRRLSLDLTGLPPTINEVDAFLADRSPDAYERLVDRLLASPHYGEKMAQAWLDLARFGDSSGYQDDGNASSYPYRDYVIRAFNDNLPFDQFTTENLAGDLLPDPTLSQRIASGFNRLHRSNQEGGSDPDEFRVIYAIDRTNTTAATWMGLTMGCAQCHDHKYDPISQREFYQLYAFFNSLKGEVPITSSSPPKVLLPTNKEDERQLAELDQQLAALPESSPPTEERKKLASQRDSVLARIPWSFVWEEMEPPRAAHILTRGDFQQPGEQVTRGVPAVFPPLSTGVSDRLALARWLVDGNHPLTARVAINRLWQQCFGVGLVRTPEDFGVRGELPTHPALLDWLAIEYELIRGWDTKQILRQIVTSATYRQTSQSTPQARDIDPDNRYLTRGGRYRLSAEEIRDGALAAAGLLVREIGGRSVNPYQPESFYRERETRVGEWKWPQEPGSGLYRRGLYTFMRRTSPYPTHQSFDGPSRGECTVMRPRTNTPLQALTTLNELTFVDAACRFAERIVDQGSSTDDRVKFAFRTVISRPPTPQEQRVVENLLAAAHEQYARDPESAQALVRQSSRKDFAAKLENSVEVAAWASVAAAVLNLDETMTRE